MGRGYDRVFVYYPRGLETGGPEALHQLVDALRRSDLEASLVPIPGTETSRRVEAYTAYDAPEDLTAVDAPNVAVVSPEVYLRGVHSLRHAQGFFWWLSIDNNSVFSHLKKTTQVVSPSGRPTQPWPRAKLKQALRPIERNRMRNPRLQHLAQSHYAWTYLYANLRVLPSMLSDFVVADFPEMIDGESTRPAIAFNPSKGGSLITELRSRFPLSVEWIPIAGMSHADVLKTLSRVDVYIDLGHHPGKDRLPREAALASAVTLVARRGSGAFTLDVPIPSEHKIDTTGDVAKNAYVALQNVLADLPTALRAQDLYRTLIHSERLTFERQAQDIFIRRETGFDFSLDQLRPPL